jgi:hypothetical protein
VRARGNIVLGRLYLKRQAAFLLEFAKSTSNPELAARLVQKAADLKSQQSSQDMGLQPPDVELNGPPPRQ